MKLTKEEIERIEGWLGCYIAESPMDYSSEEDEKIMTKIKQINEQSGTEKTHPDMDYKRTGEPC